MKNLLAFFFFILIGTSLYCQSNFSTENYANFLEENKDLNYQQLTQMHPLSNELYKGFNNGSSINDYSYLDSIIEKYNLTKDEISLMEQNHFMVSERLSFNTFGEALYDVFQKDMPVFVTTDAILHSLHMSYNAILKNIEQRILEDNIKLLVSKLYNKVPTLANKYKNYPELSVCIEDIDLYATIAYSLSENTLKIPRYASAETLNKVWNVIQAEKYIKMPLFTTGGRELDFSQFTVRGHYTDGLENYFKTMMWLGRMEFMLTNFVTYPLAKEDIQRLTIDAFLLNECMTLIDAYDIVELNESIIEYFVGESDNLKPDEFNEVCTNLAINSANQLIDTVTYKNLVSALKANNDYQQNILGNILITDFTSAEPEPLPIVYKIMGQRFILDSYILCNVVFDKIFFDDKKIWRPMPDPLDAMFVLGNNNALPLLQSELETYHYNSNLASLRYLVDSYDNEFWASSYYNGWLNAIRKLYVSNDLSKYPLFYQTAAWQQEKLNTQLASWSQLRHDNLLYAKPSYTEGVECMYPHSYVEPNPEFFKHLTTITMDMAEFFTSIEDHDDHISAYSDYFKNFSIIITNLQSIANKELKKTSLNDTDKEFLQNMLFENNNCGPIFNGWYTELFYIDEDEIKPDFIIADIHTQPTNEDGVRVGNVMHAATGKINLGVFLSNSPSAGYKPMAYVGPVYSFYENHTTGFERLTDDDWEAMVDDNVIPIRPNWVNIYLADVDGNKYEEGRELPSKAYTMVNVDDIIFNNENLLKVYSNPSGNSLIILLSSNTNNRVDIMLYNNLGKLIMIEKGRNILSGQTDISMSIGNINTGLYYFVVKGAGFNAATKFIKQ